jgi:hypothetical protein
MTGRNDWMLDAIDEVARTAENAHRAIDEVVEMIGATRAQRQGGARTEEIFDGLVNAGGRRKRLRAAAALDEFEHAILVYRAGCVRALVNEESATFSDLGRRMEVSRQMVARLYRTAGDSARGARSPEP